MKIKEELIQKYGDAVEFHDVMPGPPYIFRYPTVSFSFYVEYFMGSAKFIKVDSPYKDVPLRTCAVEDIIPKVGRFIKLMEEHDGPTHCPIIVAYQERAQAMYCNLGLFCFSDVGRT